MNGSIMNSSEAQIASWTANAERWTAAVRARTIESRRLATDAAILFAARAEPLGKALDVGCGEGWLCRQLRGEACEIVGVDASPELIARAGEEDANARYLVMSYAQLASDPQRLGADFDTVICNFSLLDDKTESLLDALALISKPRVRLLIQTLHPISLTPYEDGWRVEGFEGFGDGWAPMPYYGRTLGSWINAVSQKWALKRVLEPRGPGEKPLSLLLAAERR